MADLEITARSLAHIKRHVDQFTASDPDRTRYITLLQDLVNGIDPTGGGFFLAGYIRPELVTATGRGPAQARADAQVALGWLDELIADSRANVLASLSALFEDGYATDEFDRSLDRNANG